VYVVEPQGLLGDLDNFQKLVTQSLLFFTVRYSGSWVFSKCVTHGLKVDEDTIYKVR
jgi:hypothetical protein